jgi:hypothetical protein
MNFTDRLSTGFRVETLLQRPKRGEHCAWSPSRRGRCESDRGAPFVEHVELNRWRIQFNLKAKGSRCQTLRMCRRRGATARGNRKFACGGQLESGSAILAIRPTNEWRHFFQANRRARTSRRLRASKRKASIHVKRSCRPEATASCAAARSVRASVSTTTLRSREACARVASS